MADNIPNQRKGLIESFSELISTLLAAAYTRLNILSIDIEEAIAHLLNLVMLSLVTLCCLFIGTLLIVIFLVVVFWETHRLMTLGLLAGFFLAAGLAVWWYALHKTRTKPRLFSVSLFELIKDR